MSGPYAAAGYSRYSDSLAMPDSIIVPDTLSVQDSAALPDSVVFTDSLPVTDSLPFTDTLCDSTAADSSTVLTKRQLRRMERDSIRRQKDAYKDSVSAVKQAVLDSIHHVRDSIKSFKDSVRWSKPRILETGYLPDSLYYSARIDGASNWKYLWRIMVPIAKPSLVTIMLLNAISCWNSFLWTLLVINSDDFRTLPIGLYAFMTEGGSDFKLQMAASTFTVLPMIILFLFTRKYIVNGVARGGIKG